MMTNTKEEFVYLFSVHDPTGEMSITTQVYKTYGAAHKSISNTIDRAYRGLNIATSETVGYRYHVSIYDHNAVKVAEYSIKRMQVLEHD